MTDPHANDPLHGVTLKAILEDLIERRGFQDLADQVRIRCFMSEPSIGSSLKFLRRTGWARRQVEELYLADQWEMRRSAERSAPVAPPEESPNHGRAEVPTSDIAHAAARCAAAEPPPNEGPVGEDPVGEDPVGEDSVGVDPVDEDPVIAVTEPKHPSRWRGADEG